MSYFIVEYRLPITITEAHDAEDAASKARKEIEKSTGILLSSWHARVFEFSEDGDKVGPIAEYFFPPSGRKARKIDANFKETDDPSVQN